jgi:hypothetical protein
MPNYVNNWIREITLEQGATSCPIDLPDGEYRLTLADAATGATRWEIVDASVVSGAATLTRGLEGTADQDWLNGSVIYCALTAGTLAELSAGGAGGVTVSDEPPTQAPAQAGEAWVVTGYPFQRQFVAVGSNGPEDWLPSRECPPTQDYQAASVAPTHSIARHDKEVGIYSPFQQAGTFGLMLVMPAWVSSPLGFLMNVDPQPGAAISLSLDFAAIVQSGEVFSGAIVDYTGGAQGSVSGSVVTLDIDSRVRISNLVIERWDDEGTSNVQILMDLRNAPDPVPEFIDLTGV